MPTDTFNSLDTIDPIDMAENTAQSKNWDYDRISEDQIAMAVEGQWRTYSITVASQNGHALRLVCTYDFEPPEEKLSKICKTLNHINDNLWGSSVTYWKEQSLIVVRSFHQIIENDVLPEDFITHFIENAVQIAEQYYPAIQLTAWTDQTPEEAIKATISTPSGKKLRPN